MASPVAREEFRRQLVKLDQPVTVANKTAVFAEIERFVSILADGTELVLQEDIRILWGVQPAELQVKEQKLDDERKLIRRKEDAEKVQIDAVIEEAQN